MRGTAAGKSVAPAPRAAGNAGLTGGKADGVAVGGGGVGVDANEPRNGMAGDAAGPGGGVWAGVGGAGGAGLAGIGGTGRGVSAAGDCGCACGEPKAPRIGIPGPGPAGFRLGGGIGGFGAIGGFKFAGGTGAGAAGLVGGTGAAGAEGARGDADAPAPWAAVIVFVSEKVTPKLSPPKGPRTSSGTWTCFWVGRRGRNWGLI